MNPEQKARQNIDRTLTAAGWAIQDRDEMNLGESRGVAIREFAMVSGTADYLLIIDRKAAGVIEAKPEGTTLSGVSEQTEKYLTGIPTELPYHQNPLPFGYESTGVETFFRDLRDPDSRSRRVFAFHKPETLAQWVTQRNMLRNLLKELPLLDQHGLRNCQIDAIVNLEKSLAENRPRALIQMATGSGKTYTAVSLAYRLIKFAEANRILFLVDRSNLGRQTLKEFQQYTTPDDGRKFAELYNVQNLTTNHIDEVSKVCITTIQRLYSMLKGASDLDEQIERRSMFDMILANQPAPLRTWNTIPIFPSRPLISSSQTSAIAQSTTDGGPCWNTSTPLSLVSPPLHQSRHSDSSIKIWLRNTATSERSRMASTSGMMCIVSRQRLRTKAAASKQAFTLTNATGSPAKPDGNSLMRIWNTAQLSLTALS